MINESIFGGDMMKILTIQRRRTDQPHLKLVAIYLEHLRGVDPAQLLPSIIGGL